MAGSAVTDLSDPHPDPATLPAPGPGMVRAAAAFLRNLWRRLTNMRTALILLFLLAVASLPGALLPQWTLSRSKTAQFMLDHRTAGRWLDQLGFFNVFSSPWYAAIYLLLFTSLVGCLLPRTIDVARQLRMQPVATPRNLARLPLHADAAAVGGDPAAVAAAVTTALRRRHWRVAQRTETDGAVTISAERGYLRELGNLLFHLSLVGLLVAVAVGKLVGFEGSVLVDTGSGFCSVGPVSYDDFRPGILVDGTGMAPFCVDVRTFRSAYTPQGRAAQFAADIGYQSGSDLGTDRWSRRELQVNDPLRINGERLYLLGHGFTPHFRITYPSGAVRDYSQPFQPTDSSLVSQGVVKVTDPPDWTGTQLLTHQLAVVGLFAPTQRVTGGIMTSAFPAARNPGVAIQVYRGDLGLDSGRPQSVFSIDSRQVANGLLVRQKTANLSQGQSVRLDDGTTITFTGYNEWVNLQTSYDPAQLGALISAVVLLCGLTLSLSVRRRRVWYRMRPHSTTGGQTLVEVAGLARTDAAGYGHEFAALSQLPFAGVPADPGSRR